MPLSGNVELRGFEPRSKQTFLYKSARLNMVKAISCVYGYIYRYEKLRTNQKT